MKHFRLERTDPYFVKVNRRPTNVWHRHQLFGKQVSATRLVRDAEGKALYEPRVVTCRISDVLGDPLTLYSSISEAVTIAKAARSRGASMDDTISFTHPTWVRQVTETVVRGVYADFCTAGLPQDRDGASIDDPELFLPCVPHLSWWELGKAFPRNKLEREFYPQKDHRREGRSQTRALRRWANSGYDLDDILSPLV